MKRWYFFVIISLLCSCSDIDDKRKKESEKIYLKQKNDDCSYFKHFSLTSLEGKVELTDKVDYPFFEICKMNEKFVRVRSHVRPDTVNAVFLKKIGPLFTMYNRVNKKPDGEFPYDLDVIDTVEKRKYSFDGFGGIFDSKNNIRVKGVSIQNFSNPDSILSTTYKFGFKKLVGKITKSNMDRLYAWLARKDLKVSRRLFVKINDDIIEYKDSLVKKLEGYPYYEYVSNRVSPIWKEVPKEVESEDKPEDELLEKLLFPKTCFDDENLDRTHRMFDNLDNNFRMGLFRIVNTRRIDLNKEEFLD